MPISSLLPSGISLNLDKWVPHAVADTEGQIRDMKQLASALGGSPAGSKRKKRKKTIDTPSSHYRMSRKQLEEMGLSKQDIEDILEATKYASCKAVKKALDVYDLSPAFLRPLASFSEWAEETERMANPDHPFNTMGFPVESASLRNPEIKSLLDSLQTNAALNDTAVYLGNSRFFNRLRRILRNKKLSKMDRFKAILEAPKYHRETTMDRADHYDPDSNTFVVFHNSPGVAAHESGHGFDTNTANDLALHNRQYAQNRMSQEFLASNLGLTRMARNLVADKEITRAKVRTMIDEADTLRKAYNSYANHYMRGADKGIQKRYDRLIDDPLRYFIVNKNLGRAVGKLRKQFKV